MQEQIHSEEDGLGSERIRRSNTDRIRRKDIKHRERHSIDAAANSDALVKARVIGVEGAFYVAMTAEGEEIRTRTVKSTVSENHNATLVAVGDDVGIERGESDGQHSGEIVTDNVIRRVYERRTKLARRLHKRSDAFEQVIAANVDVLCITMSCVEPPFRPGICDRYIIAGLDGGLDIYIVLNKIDLLDEDPSREFIIEALEYYSGLGYIPHLTSTETGEGIDELREGLRGKTSVFAGKSGVGKSSLVNSLLGEVVARTSELTSKERRGVHTTTNSSLLPLAGVDDSYIIDTPGVREFFNYELDDENLKYHYPEFEKFAADCDMTNCTHTHEPGCAVFAAIEKGEIPEWRYNSYASLYEEAVRERKKLEGRM